MKLNVMAFLVLILLIASSPVVLAGSGTTPSGIPLAEVESFVDQFVEAHIGQSTPGAAVVLVKDGEIVLSKGYGYADIDNEIKVDPANTVFEYGSVSKLFVYTTIMQLVEQGQIDLETDIREYLPAGFLKKLNSDTPITMLNIMNHTAGFEDYLFDVILTVSDSLPALERALQEFQPEQVYEPGTVAAYSNYAVALAAYIAEGFLGQDFYEYLMDSVFVPLGMETTSAHITLADKPELLDSKATAYFPGRDGFSPGPWSYVVPYPAGSVTGTAEDLARFDLALLPADGEAGPLFTKRSTLDEMLSQPIHWARD
ncbi:MAG: serine hydrolase [Firmicutes bacterium]|nr:serine hydrolase [Bacillota bacterium]